MTVPSSPLRAAFLLFILTAIPGIALAVRHSEATWTAHPPLHIAHDASVAPVGYTPAQIRHAYGFDAVAATGKSRTIAIVDAYDAPNIASDLGTFIATFRIPGMYGVPGTKQCTIARGPHPCFQRFFAQKKPTADAGWSLETSLDVEWAHVAAPGADIALVETQNSSLTALLRGVDVAAAHGAAVSMSWGGPEFPNETAYDKHFQKSGVAFFASSGDNGTGQSYPAASPYVIAVGGTTLPLDGRGSPAGKEKGWQGSGGGVSTVERQPAYQARLTLETGGRAGPDVSYDGDPATGVAVYDSTPYNGKSGWYALGGTSAASPQWAGIAALADEGRTVDFLSTDSADRSFIYDAADSPGTLRDIRTGRNGPCGTQCKAAAGYDLVTGLGSPAVDVLVPILQRK